MAVQWIQLCMSIRIIQWCMLLRQKTNYDDDDNDQSERVRYPVQHEK